MPPRTHRIELRIDTPAGAVTLFAHDAREAADLRARVTAWLAGADDAFPDVPLPDGTDFQRRCWAACRRIPRGETRTYAWLAAEAGSPGAARAAGQAMRRNPLPIVVPCHRVTGSGGWLGGYAGEAGRDDRAVALKRFLLSVERAAAAVPSPTRPRTRARTALPETSPA
jgi:O-6-methylguanine DNA methyltransferase